MYALIELTHPKGYRTYEAVKSPDDARKLHDRCTLESLQYRCVDRGEHGENLFSVWLGRTPGTFYGSILACKRYARVFSNGVQFTRDWLNKPQNKAVDVTV